MYVDLLKLGPTSADAAKLKNYRAPKGGGGGSSSSSKDAGDFAAVLYSVLKDRCGDKEEDGETDKGLSIAEVSLAL